VIKHNKHDLYDIQVVTQQMAEAKQNITQEAKEAIVQVQKCFQEIRQECDKREQILISQINQLMNQRIAYAENFKLPKSSLRITIDHLAIVSIFKNE
jgi:hypothetical protein